MTTVDKPHVVKNHPELPQQPFDFLEPLSFVVEWSIDSLHCSKTICTNLSDLFLNLPPFSQLCAS